MVAKQKNKRPRGLGGCAGCGGVMAISFLGFLLIGTIAALNDGSLEESQNTEATVQTRPDSPPPPADLRGDKIDAHLRAEDAVKSMMQFPSEVSFTWGATRKIEDNIAGRPGWRILGEVKAPNAFGLFYKQPYKVRMYPSDSGGWTIASIVVGDEISYTNPAAVVDALELQKLKAAERQRVESERQANLDRLAAEAEVRRIAALREEFKGYRPDRKFRTFRSPDGERSVVGKLLGMKDGKAVLESREEGKRRAFSKTQLSEEDLDYVRVEVKRALNDIEAKE